MRRPLGILAGVLGALLAVGLFSFFAALPSILIGLAPKSKISTWISTRMEETDPLIVISFLAVVSAGLTFLILVKLKKTMRKKWRHEKER